MHSSLRTALLSTAVMVTVAWAGPVKAIRLDKTKSFPPVYQQAAIAVFNEVKSKGKNPETLYAEVRQVKSGSLIFYLWSAENYRLLRSKRPVNPGGSIQVTVNPKNGAILETVFEQ